MRTKYWKRTIGNFLIGLLILSGMATGCERIQFPEETAVTEETTAQEETTQAEESDTEAEGMTETDSCAETEASDGTDTELDSFIDALQDLYALDTAADKRNADGSMDEPCRLILTDVDLDEEALAKYNASHILYDGCGNIILQFDSDAACEKALEELQEDVGADHVERDAVINVLPEENISVEAEALTTQTNVGTASASAGSLSYGPEMIGATTFISNMTSSQKKESVVVAVIDTGVDTDHEFLSSHLVTGTSIIASSYEDGNGHGTHVSGIIVDSTQGTNVKIMPVQVLDANGSGNNSSVATGITWAVNNGAKVINLSLGGYDYSSSHYLDSAVNNAVSNGVTVVVAAGNDGGSTTYFCPGHIESAITVGAVDSSSTIAYFSNYGTSQDLAAPGVDIYSSIIGSYGTMSGTSMATPFVSASAALLLAAGVASGPSSVNSVLQSYSKDCGTSGWDMYYGAGVVQLASIDPSSTGENPTEATTETPTTTEAPTTEEVTEKPTKESTEAPTEKPTKESTEAPTEKPTKESTEAPTEKPTKESTEAPTEKPTEESTEAPTEKPTEESTEAPTEKPTKESTAAPTDATTAPSGYEGTGISVSSNSSTNNGKYTATLTIKTDADISVLTIEVDGKDYHSRIVYDGNNTYHISFSSSGHSYYIANPSGSISSSGSF